MNPSIVRARALGELGGGDDKPEKEEQRTEREGSSED